MRKSILVTIIILVLLGVFYTAASASFPPPPDDSCCETHWWELFHIPNSKYCNGGDYYIWHCKELDSKDILYTSVCLSSIQPLEEEVYTVYLPYIVKE